MNKRFKKSVLITVIILISSIFINCDNTTTIKNKFKILVLKNNLKKTVKEKKTRENQQFVSQIIINGMKPFTTNQESILKDKSNIPASVRKINKVLEALNYF